MASLRSNPATEMKTAAQLWAEEEARVEIARAKAEMDARRATKEKAEDEIWGEAAVERARAKARAAAKARDEEEARIDATGKDEWFYIQNELPCGPVLLAKLREMIADASIDPPVKSVWAEGMDGWKPVYEVRRVCEPMDSGVDVAGVVAGFRREPGSERSEKTPVVGESRNRKSSASESLIPERGTPTKADAAGREIHAKENRIQAETEARLKAAEEAKAKAEARADAEVALRVAAEAQAAADAKVAMEARARAQAEEYARRRAEQEAGLKAAAETKLRDIAEARARNEENLRKAAEARALEEARKREAAEAKAADEARIAAAARAKAELEAIAKAKVEAKAAGRLH